MKLFICLCVVGVLIVGMFYIENREQKQLEDSIPFQKGYADYPNDTLYNEVIETGSSGGIFVNSTLHRYRKGWEQAESDELERIKQSDYDAKKEYADSVIEKIDGITV